MTGTWWRAHARSAAASRVAGLAAALALVAGVLVLPAAHSSFSAATSNGPNALAADQLQPPSGLAAAQACLPSAIAVQAVSGAAGSTRVDLGIPSGTQAGDVLVVQIAFRSGATTITAPAGWTQVQAATSGTELTSAMYVKTAAAGEPTASFTRATTTGEMGGILAVYRGVHPTAPVVTSGSATGTGATATTPSLSVTATDTVVLHVLAKRQEALPAPAGTTQRWRASTSSDPTGLGSVGADEPFPAGGTTPSRSATGGSASEWVTHALVLRAALYPAADLTWTATPSTWATGHRLERLVGATLQATRTITPVGTTAVRETPLVSGVTYTFRLRAYRGSWVSPVVTTTLTTSC